MYTLYGGKFTRALMTEMVFAELGVPYELIAVDTMNAEHRSEAFLKINPAGWVPALKTPEGAVLYETPAINLYLAERHGLGELVPALDDPRRGLFLSSLFYLTDELEPALKRYFFPHRYGVRDTDEGEIRQLSLKAVCACLEVIDGRLKESGPYHLGDQFSLADLTLSFWIRCLLDKGAVSEFRAVLECVDLVRNRPLLRRLFANHDESMKAYAELDADGQRPGGRQ
ncbi:MAG: glutathione S-transferase family protein [Rhizobiaceae bacterium]